MIPPVLKEIHKELKRAGATHVLLVGGAVRDIILGSPVSDFDTEIFGMNLEDIMTVLRKFGNPELVGESFGVIKLRAGERCYDFSLPRTEWKTGVGHKGFSVTINPDMDIVTAASRRDFTMNSMALENGRLIDPFHGESDLRAGILRHTSDAFVEDPLRVLRGMQFAGRFDLEATPSTIEISRSLARHFQEIAGERVFVEFCKWARGSRVPSAGLRFLKKSGWIECFPDLAAMVKTSQNPLYHQEGSVWNHTSVVVDRMAVILDGEGVVDRLALMFAALLHDVGKPVSTQEIEGEISSRGHAQVGAGIAESFLRGMRAPLELTQRVQSLVREHMSPRTDLSPRAIRRLSRRLSPATIREFLMLKGADRGGLDVDNEKFLAIANNLHLADEPPKPILMGRHLLDLMPPGPDMGTVLRAVFEMQIDDEVGTVEEGLVAAKKLIMELDS